jgi:hypothetical protein
LSLDDKRGLSTPQLQPGKMLHAFCFLLSQTGTNSAIVLSCCIFATIVNSEQLRKKNRDFVYAIEKSRDNLRTRVCLFPWYLLCSDSRMSYQSVIWQVFTEILMSLNFTA